MIPRRGAISPKFERFFSYERGEELSSVCLRADDFYSSCRYHVLFSEEIIFFFDEMEEILLISNTLNFVQKYSCYGFDPTATAIASSIFLGSCKFIAAASLLNEKKIYLHAVPCKNNRSAFSIILCFN